MIAETFADQVGLRRLRPDNVVDPAIEHFISTHYPAQMGNQRPIAYGGCTLGVAIHAACQSVWSHPNHPSPDFKLYSIVGHFLGPAKTDRFFSCEVSRVRESRSFKTRRVILTQRYDDGSVRECMALTADFMKIEKEGEMEFSAPPVGNAGKGAEYFTSKELGPGGKGSGSMQEIGADLVTKGEATTRDVEIVTNMFGLGAAFVETRLCRDGVGGQTLGGLAKRARSSQGRAGVPITDKTTTDWIRIRDRLPTEGENMAGLGFTMDGGLSFLPLIHAEEGKFVDDIGPCSSLDFSMRLFQTGDERLELDKWHLKERKTIAAAGGRSYSEGRLWNAQGKLVAIMSQMGILRPKATGNKL